MDAQRLSVKDVLHQLKMFYNSIYIYIMSYLYMTLISRIIWMLKDYQLKMFYIS